ncbi:MAG: HDOD domain-containing protein, partial [Pseudomonadota bacterium]
AVDAQPDPTTRVTPELLRKFPLLAALTQASLGEAVKNAQLRDYDANERLFKAGRSDDWEYFLIHGKVELTSGDVKVRSIDGNSDQARDPIAPDLPRVVTARTLVPSTFLRLPKSLLETLDGTQKKSTEVYEVTEFHSNDNYENQVRFSILQEFAADQFELPSLPEIALKVRQAVSDPEVTASSVERIVTADPAVAARLIQVSNSPAYAGTTKVETCRDAVIRLGLPTTRELVTALIMRQMFESKVPFISKRMRSVWSHSTHVGAVACELALMVKGFNPDRALLAGLVHDIGVLPVLKKIEQDSDLIRSTGELEGLLTKLRGEVGSLVLRHWDFPEDIILTALEAETWHREHDGPADYCDLVLVAQVFSYMGTPHFSKLPNVTTLSAFQRLGLNDVDPSKTLEALERARGSIDELRSIIA